MSLSDLTIQRAKARSKPYKIFDSRGLFLQVMPHGGKWWRFKYRYAGKEKLLSLGVYPDASLKAARDRRDAEREKLANRVDPAINRKVVKAAWLNGLANSFEVIATGQESAKAIYRIARCRVIYAILLRRQNPKIFRIDDTEVIGDGIPV